jgi:hypothetical protein
MTDNDFNKVPFEGSWTAGQVVDHILKSVEGVANVISAEAISTERAPDEFVKSIADTFLDFNVKFESPDFVLPGDPPHDRTVLLDKTREIFNELCNLVETKDLSLTYTEFKLPGSPEMTRLEWAYFALFHTQRHLRQLRNIKNFE